MKTKKPLTVEVLQKRLEKLTRENKELKKTISFTEWWIWNLLDHSEELLKLDNEDGTAFPWRTQRIIKEMGLTIGELRTHRELSHQLHSMITLLQTEKHQVRNSE